jgi:diguanylate cyclase (GGDEF)-like protein
VDPSTTLGILSAHLLLSGFLFARVAAGMASREGIEDWSGGSFLASMGLLLRIPDQSPLFHVASDVLLLGGALLFLRGTRTFVRPQPRRANPPLDRRFALLLVALGLLQIPMTLRGVGGLFVDVLLSVLLLAIGWTGLHASRRDGGVAVAAISRSLRGLGALFVSLGLGTITLSLLPLVQTGSSMPVLLLEQFLPPLLAWLVLSVAFAQVWMVFSRMHGRMEGLASEDPLTEILNRRGLQQRINRHFERRGSEPVVFLLGDLDYFKSVNDRFGHEGGDEVLRQVAAVLKVVCRRGDFVARFGGEEFLIGCVDATTDLGLRLADRIRSEVSALRIEVGNGEWVRCTISIGVSEPFRRPDLWRRALAQADRAMYEAKARGRDRSVAFGELPPEEQEAAEVALDPRLPRMVSST